MNAAGWSIIILAGLLGLWMVTDGTRSFVTGDFVTPSSGKHVGQLGPWATVLRTVGIEPRSTAVKVAHIVIGAIWLVCSVSFLLKLGWAWWGMLGCAIATLWYLPFGTIIGAAEVGLLLLPSVREIFLR